MPMAKLALMVLALTMITVAPFADGSCATRCSLAFTIDLPYPRK